MRYRCTSLLVAVLLAAASAGCRPDWQPTPTLPVIDLTGGYFSDESVGQLGRLLLIIERHEDTNVFTASLLSSDHMELGESKGVGTLGDLHLILNFDRGLHSDYYLVADLEMANSTVDYLRGEFIFPDNEQRLRVTFRPFWQAGQ